MGLEPTTSCLQSRCSSQLSYVPEDCSRHRRGRRRADGTRPRGPFSDNCRYRNALPLWSWGRGAEDTPCRRRPPNRSHPTSPSTPRRALASEIRGRVEGVLRGKPEPVTLALVALLSGGHLLVEDVPGVGKTLLAKALARSHRRGLPPGPVHPRPPALRAHRRLGVPPRRQRVGVPPGAAVRQRRARRRAEPRHAPHPVGAARGDGGAPGHRRRRHPRAAAPVLPRRDPEPVRDDRNVPARRGSARPLLRRHPHRPAGRRDRARAAARRGRR